LREDPGRWKALFIRKGFKSSHFKSSVDMIPNTKGNQGGCNRLIRKEKQIRLGHGKRENRRESKQEKIKIKTRDNHYPSFLFILPLYQWR
jgi:hypothetical protein